MSADSRSKMIPRLWRRASFLFMCLGILIAFVAIGEVIANLCLTHLPLPVFKYFASVSQYEKRVGRNFQFSYQTGFGIYPTPGYAVARNKHNSMGFRGDEVVIPKPAGIFRIACLGSSTTYDPLIDDWTRAWPGQLQAILREHAPTVEVVNAGVPSWTSREQILNYATRVACLQPDLIIIYEGINDLLYRATWPPEQLRSDYTSPFTVAPEFAKQPWYTALTLVRIPLILTGRLLPPCAIDPCWCDTFKGQGFVNVVRATGYSRWQSACGGRLSSIPSGMTLKDVFATTPTAHFERNIRSVVESAKSQHTRVLLVGLILDWRKLQRDALDHGEGLQFGIKQHNDVLEAVGKDCGVPYYDLPRDWPQDDHLWFDFIHNNESGALQKARLIADFILKTGIIP